MSLETLSPPLPPPYAKPRDFVDFTFVHLAFCMNTRIALHAEDGPVWSMVFIFPSRLGRVHHP